MIAQFCADGMRVLSVRDRTAQNCVTWPHGPESQRDEVQLGKWIEVSSLSLSVVKWLRRQGAVLTALRRGTELSAGRRRQSRETGAGPADADALQARVRTTSWRPNGITEKAGGVERMNDRHNESRRGTLFGCGAAN